MLMGRELGAARTARASFGSDVEASLVWCSVGGYQLQIRGGVSGVRWRTYELFFDSFWREILELVDLRDGRARVESERMSSTSARTWVDGRVRSGRTICATALTLTLAWKRLSVGERSLPSSGSAS